MGNRAHKVAVLNVVALSRRVTDSNVRGVSFLRQLLGNLGRFRAEDLLD